MQTQTILISRTDAIGDVLLTLPLAGLLRERLPSCRIALLCSAYTRPVVQCCEHIDEIVDWSTLEQLPEPERVERLRAVGADAVVHVFPRADIARAAWKAKIRTRIGTTHRLYHFRYCNKLIGLGRKKSPFHEAVLNIMLAQSLFSGAVPAVSDLWRYSGLTRIPPLPERVRALLPHDKKTIVLHPKSRGSAAELAPEQWKRLTELLCDDRLNIVMTGTAEEGHFIRTVLQPDLCVRDASGQMSLAELIAFLRECRGLVAASTGPLHIASALGIHALGLYPSHPPLHPGRWGPIGLQAEVLSATVGSNGFLDITAEQIFEKLAQWML